MSNTARKLQPTYETTAPATPSGFISPAIDLFMVGGGSLLFLFCMSVMLPATTPDASLSWFVYRLSFFVNFPHFLSSYLLLYSDFGNKIFKEKRFFWAAVVAPLLIIGVLTAGFGTGQPAVLGYLVNSMYFFVGWHYVKQIFGVSIVCNVKKKFFYTNSERLVLKTNLFALWAISFLGSNTGYQNFAQDGIPYQSLNLPSWPLTAAYAVLAVSAAAVVFTHWRKYVREGKLPSPLAVACILAIYAWYLPAVSHPMFMHMIPFFHSMQYLLFVYVFRRNKVNEDVGEEATPEQREKRSLRLYGYLLFAAGLGALFMYVLPRYLDSLQLHNATLFGPTPFYFAFTLFINVHHYFIDNVLWRGNNEQMKKYLFR